MEKINELYAKYKIYVLGGAIALILFVIEAFMFWYFSNDINILRKDLKKNPIVNETSKDEESKKFTVDIKGEVKKPGVYILDEGKRVIDVVRKAGGFTSDADSSPNNLSMKIKDEMVIIIYSEDQIKEFTKVKEDEAIKTEACQNGIVQNDSCITNDTVKDSKKEESSSNSKDINSDGEEIKLVSLNTGTLEELMTLPGIGEAKANSIIEYRKDKKFEKIEDIMEVSGIGEAVFEKLKDYITT